MRPSGVEQAAAEDPARAVHAPPQVGDGGDVRGQRAGADRGQDPQPQGRERPPERDRPSRSAEETAHRFRRRTDSKAGLSRTRDQAFCRTSNRTGLPSLHLDEDERAADQPELLDEVLVLGLVEVDDLPGQRAGARAAAANLDPDDLLGEGLDRPAGLAAPFARGSSRRRSGDRLPRLPRGVGSRRRAAPPPPPTARVGGSSPRQHRPGPAPRAARHVHGMHLLDSHRRRTSRSAAFLPPRFVMRSVRPSLQQLPDLVSRGHPAGDEHLAVHGQGRGRHHPEAA